MHATSKADTGTLHHSDTSITAAQRYTCTASAYSGQWINESTAAAAAADDDDDDDDVTTMQSGVSATRRRRTGMIPTL